MLEKLSEKDEQCTSLARESESLRGQLAGKFAQSQIFSPYMSISVYYHRKNICHSNRTGEEIEDCR